MKMSNVHERTIATPAARVGALLDTFSSDDDPQRLLKACARDGDPGLLPATQLALLTTMRQGEICALEWPDIDFDASTIFVRGPGRTSGDRRTKNGETRTIPFLPGVETVVQGLDRGRDRRVIKNGQNALKMRYRRAVKKAGLSDLRFPIRRIVHSRP